MQTPNFVLIEQSELALLLQAANQNNSKQCVPPKTHLNNSSLQNRDSTFNQSYFNSSLFFNQTPVQQNIWTDSYPTYPAPKLYFGD